MENYSFTFGSLMMFSLKLLINSMFTWNFWQLRFGRFHGSEIFIVRLIFCLCSASVFLRSSPLFHYKTLSHALLCQAHIKTSNYQTPRCFHLETSTIACGAILCQGKKTFFLYNKWQTTTGRCHHIKLCETHITGLERDSELETSLCKWMLDLGKRAVMAQ